MSSPLEFARSFEKLKSDLESEPAADLQLVHLAAFWPELALHREDLTVSSYVEEYRALFGPLVSERNLYDLTLEELQALQAVATDLKLTDPARLITIRLATLYAYVGEAENCVQVCAGLTGDGVSKLLADIEPVGNDELERLDSLCGHIQAPAPALYEIVRGICDASRHEREQLWQDGARCLFVEKSAGPAGQPRGRMRTLRGSVEYVRKLSNHELSLDNQVKAPDDPFVGAVYGALDAVTELLKRQGYFRGDGGGLRARLSIEESDHTFTGDSIGLAAALVAYANLLKPEILRHERFVSSEVAFTGAITANGRLTPVAEETVSIKVTRTFFSSAKYMVLPHESLLGANRQLASLRKVYSCRRLQVVGHELLPELVSDLNMVRSEKVCVGQLVTRKVYRYGRATEVQIPLLTILAYLLLCLVYPSAWIGFERNPSYAVVNPSGLHVFNVDSTKLWSITYECDSLNTTSSWVVDDLNGDGTNEVLFLPHAISYCDDALRYYVYDKQGHELFSRPTAVPEGAVSDDPVGKWPDGNKLRVVHLTDRALILTKVATSTPARSEIRMWAADGADLGWYIHRGFVGYYRLWDADSDGVEDLIYAGTNNALGCAVVLALPIGGCNGVSPVSLGKATYPSGAIRGNHIAYSAIPPSDVCREVFQQKNDIRGILLEPEDSSVRLRVDTQEGNDLRLGIRYFYTYNLRIADVVIVDTFRQYVDSVRTARGLPKHDWAAYGARLRDSVWSLSGNQWERGGGL